MKVPKWKKIYEELEVNQETKLTPTELRPLLEEKLQEIPYQ